MKIRYSKSVGIIYILTGVLFSCVYLLISLADGKGSMLLTVGFIGIMFGILFLTRTYFVLNEDGLVLSAILGSAKTTYKFQSLKELEVDNKQVYLNQDGKRRKLSISAGLADKNDWQAFLQKIKDASL
ncbi:MAG: hypothetical protein JNM55_21575 [Anaerolineales bacterium]|nr:hypothetical protein [Anaerolineales bacterium]